MYQVVKIKRSLVYGVVKEIPCMWRRCGTIGLVCWIGEKKIGVWGRVYGGGCIRADVSGGSDSVVFLGGINADGFCDRDLRLAEGRDAIRTSANMRIVATHTDVDAGVDLEDELTDTDISSDDCFNARTTDAASLASAIAAVAVLPPPFLVAVSLCSYQAAMRAVGGSCQRPSLGG